MERRPMSQEVKKKDEFDFDITEQSCPVKLSGERYLIVEADGSAGTEYRNAAAKGIKFNPQGKPSGVDGIADAQLILVGKCLFKLVKDNNEKKTLISYTDLETNEVLFRQPVHPEYVRGLPDRISQKLFDKASELSGMNNEKETAKNS
jgi:hypothetical protein